MPEILKAILSQFGVAGSVLDVAVAEVMLECPRILAIVGQLVTGGVSQHMRVDRELEADMATGASI